MPLGNSAEFITVPLRMLVTTLSVAIGNYGLGIDVIRQGSLIFDGNHTFQYDVAPACSGIRSLVTLLALTTIYGFLSFRKNWKRWLMVFLAFPLAVAGNTLRITIVIMVGGAFGQQAGARIEQKLGFLTFALAFAVVLLVGHWLREGQRAAQRHSPKPAPPAGPRPVPAPAASSPTESSV
jgi:exosortase